MKTRLKELRLSKGLTQKDVAEVIKVSPQSYGYYENWVNKPDPETLIKLADLFECSIDYLLGRENDFGVSSENHNLTSSQIELLSVFNLLSNDDQNKVLGYIKALEE
ncbi:MAG: helix-turn-helix transcriptional regulator [Clostridia bacterium]|nr:helix-turn-helix transcriptional regulator [Clostridia bacterium]